MSLDLEVRSDDEYTGAAPREVLVAWLQDEVLARATEELNLTTLEPHWSSLNAVRHG